MRSSDVVLGRHAEAPAVVLPQPLVREIVEVEVFEVLELGARGGEQLLADLDVRIHRAADVEQQQQLHGVAPLGHELEVEQAGVARRGVDGAVEIELLGARPRARSGAGAAAPS